MAGGEPILAPCIDANDGRIIHGSVKEGDGGGSFLGRAVGVDHVHAFDLHRLQKVDPVSGRSGPENIKVTALAIRGATLFSLGDMFAHFATEPAIAIAPTAARNANHADAGGFGAGDKGGVGQQRFRPGGHVGAADTRVDRRTSGGVIELDGHSGGRWLVGADQADVVQIVNGLGAAVDILPVDGVDDGWGPEIGQREIHLHPGVRRRGHQLDLGLIFVEENADLLPAGRAAIQPET